MTQLLGEEIKITGVAFSVAKAAGQLAFASRRLNYKSQLSPPDYDVGLMAAVALDPA